MLIYGFNESESCSKTSANERMIMSERNLQGDKAKEAVGWATLAMMMVLFPVLFFLCVFFPIWIGWTSPW